MATALDRRTTPTGQTGASTGVGLEVVNLSKRYDGHPALAGVDLKVRPGEFFTLLGPSGCGKTTLLRLIAGLERPDGGDVLIDGREVTTQAAHARKVNTVFQSYALFPHLNVADNVAFGLRMQGMDKPARQRKVAEMLAFMHIEALAGRRPEQLSGGQQQRVALARALVNEPQILLLDEPLSALDAKLRAELQLELKRTQRRLGMTFVLVTHDQAEALTLSDRIAVMRDGLVEQVGGVTELYERPRTAYVAEFLGQANSLEVNGITGDEVDTPIGRLRLHEPPAAGLHQVMVRPERLSLGATADEACNRFEARVVERIYLGAGTRYALDVGGAALVAMVTHQSHDTHLPAEGETVQVQVHPRDIVPLAER
ncbi:ABC transporter ATP-binding protein [Acidihalobacter prosperus]|uniref:ABC transporter ATP-binding protein n=1 Tax=Acidihalobacter prosperus TaxID=160660 RepID=UPI0013735FAB|nr:ABC transporter ATP-binding protein [Acidihalobacter prosperus]